MNTATSHQPGLDPANHRTDDQPRTDCSISSLSSADVEARPGAAERRRDDLATRPKYVTIKRWGDMVGDSRTRTYEDLSRGNLRAIKRGGRTLIDVDHGLAYLATLPTAKFNAPKSAA